MENGEIMIVDRIKEVMKYRGHQISPSEIEEYLTSHKAVMEAAVVPVPHELDLEVPMAFIARNPGFKVCKFVCVWLFENNLILGKLVDFQVTEEELINFSAELGDVKKLRGGVKFLEKLPYTASGKINRKLLKELAKVYNM